MNSYDLSRAWFDFCFDNPELACPAHTAVYFFAIDHCNKLGWKKKFGLPTVYTMEATGIKSKNTYYKSLNFLIDNKFIKMIQKSKNQNSANIISISATSKIKSARDTATIQQVSQQLHSNEVSTVPIVKPITNKPITNNKDIELPSFINPASWNDFLTHRKELKKPLTPTSMKGQLKKLEKFESSFPGGANISLEQTVNNGWQGLFEPKIEEFKFESAPWKILNNGEKVKLDMKKLIVYAENGKQHDLYEVDSDGGVTC